MAVNQVDAIVNGIFIGGKELEVQESVTIYNPALTEQKVGSITVGTISHVNQAVQEAEKAWENWSEINIEKRASYLLEIADYIETNMDELSRLLVLEHGKILKEAVIDLKGAAGTFRYYASLTNALDDEIVKNHQGTMILSRLPVGVVSVIVPWNFPIILAALMIAPSLLAGNVVIVKPPTFVPLTLTKILTHLAKQLPAGVLNIVTGSGSTVGKEMVEHPRIRKIAFTGSTETGRSIMAGAAKNIKKVSMELGGNDAAIFLKDKPITDEVIQEAIAATFTAAGQICYSMKRIYVHRDNYELFVSKFTEAANKLVVGFGLDPDVNMGPINNKQQYESILKLMEKTKNSGVTIKEVGKLTNGTSLSDGYFIMPTIVTGVKNSDPIVQEEQFGPIIPIIPFDTEEEVVKLVNDSEFGLANSIWTSDEDKGFDLGRKLESGSVFINTHRLGSSAANMPFGGFKQSGIGRGHGVESLYEHTELQARIRRIDM